MRVLATVDEENDSDLLEYEDLEPFLLFIDKYISKSVCLYSRNRNKTTRIKRCSIGLLLQILRIQFLSLRFQEVCGRKSCQSRDGTRHVKTGKMVQGMHSRSIMPEVEKNDDKMDKHQN